MGYVRERPIYKLVFEDPEMDGLVVRVRSMPFGEALTVGARVAADDGTVDLAKAADLFFDFFVEWNLEDEVEGERAPAPATVDGLFRHDKPFVQRLLMAWIRSIGQVPDPLERPSRNGSRSLEESIPMAVSSASR